MFGLPFILIVGAVMYLVHHPYVAAVTVSAPLGLAVAWYRRRRGTRGI